MGFEAYAELEFIPKGFGPGVKGLDGLKGFESPLSLCKLRRLGGGALSEP
jgi:hypothetical protein